MNAIVVALLQCKKHFSLQKSFYWILKIELNWIKFISTKHEEKKVYKMIQSNEVEG